MTAIAILAAFLLGCFAWSVGEYHLHRFAMHHLRGKGILSREHLVHHGDPERTNLGLRLLAYLGVIVVGAATALLASIWLPLAFTAPFAAGWLVGYTFYELLHWRAHFRPPRWRYELSLRRQHFHHHFGHPMENHGVTSALWDRVYGTHAQPSVIKVPERMAMSWLVDERGRVRPEYANDYELVTTDARASARMAATDERRAFANQAPLAEPAPEPSAAGSADPR